MKELGDKGLGLASISYDAPELVAGFAKLRGITFPMLSDFGSAAIKTYGLLNPVPEMAFGPDRENPAVQAEIQKYVSVVRPAEFMKGMAFPGTFILDRQGRVTARYFEDFYLERNTVSSLMVKLGSRAGSAAGTKISTGKLDVTTYPSDPAVAAGNRFSLVLDIVPAKGIHVYAPGVGDSQSSSTKRMSCCAGSTPSARRLSRYWSWMSSGDGFRTTWYW